MEVAKAMDQNGNFLKNFFRNVLIFWFIKNNGLNVRVWLSLDIVQVHNVIMKIGIMVKIILA